ncbi:class I SAM-dependent methyltransferase [Pseudomonas oryzihabitans]|uniref:SAM-dependent methyltransferase n=1 Tax=Pseudomonas oryzihabitans TaxID=47885 RepID=A0AAJ2BM42_9PSED|nr:class I SAM-dependent methyltransferase [Pseudomonas psychrotolerans]MDR6236989.1 SAM-dependent methyltransferase [Pseudomonas psychrotolerans]MDR6353570.1 SAM-dependent methyltransferase [Pseudomonas psychrotolerans]
MTVSMSYFDTLYAGNADPWDYRHRWYEARKRDLTLAILPHRRYTKGYEPGCSTGELSRRLAERCDHLLVSDGNASAVATASARLADQHHVEVRHLLLPGGWPEGAFDLIVISEIGYYLGEQGLDALLDHAHSALLPGGVLLGCHWRHPIDGCSLTGDQVHERLAALPGLHRLSHLEESDFVLTLWSSDPTSVARREQLL